jgi:hypothetical protein
MERTPADKREARRQAADAAAAAHELCRSLLESPGWRNYLSPRLAREIASAERSILDDTSLTGRETRAMRARRKALREVLDWPTQDLAVARKTMLESAGAGPGGST